jgi:hypothetical protein
MQTLHNRQPSKTKRRILGMILRLWREDCGLRQGLTCVARRSAALPLAA